jgi:predicted ArsR family transcriptional regulator
LCAAYHGGAKTSVEAFRSVSTSARNAQQLSILEFIKSRGSATCDEAEVALGISHQACSARVTELLKSKRISFGEETRPTRSGRSARVYRVV